MTIATAVTGLSKGEEVKEHPVNGGRYVQGLYIEGAAWMHDEEECEDYDVNGVVCRYVGCTVCCVGLICNRFEFLCLGLSVNFLCNKIMYLCNNLKVY